MRSPHCVCMPLHVPLLVIRLSETWLALLTSIRPHCASEGVSSAGLQKRGIPGSMLPANFGFSQPLYDEPTAKQIFLKPLYAGPTNQLMFYSQQIFHSHFMLGQWPSHFFVYYYFCSQWLSVRVNIWQPL